MPVLGGSPIPARCRRARAVRSAGGRACRGVLPICIAVRVRGSLRDLMARVLRAAWPALAIIALGLAPFLDKAFTIDDTLFLRVAEHALVAPFEPMAFPYVWTDHPERM